ncbi:hypothetical protein ACFOPN_14285 [Xanthomonas hyacinthi]
MDTIVRIRFNASADFDEQRKLKAGAPVHSPFIRRCSELQPH